MVPDVLAAAGSCAHIHALKFVEFSMPSAAAVDSAQKPAALQELLCTTSQLPSFTRAPCVQQRPQHRVLQGLGRAFPLLVQQAQSPTDPCPSRD